MEYRKWTLYVGVLALLAGAGMIRAEAKAKAGLSYNLQDHVYMVMNPSRRSSGTTFPLSVKGRVYFITNWHVCQGADNGVMLIVLKDASSLPAVVVKVDAGHDLCALEGPTFTPLYLNDKSPTTGDVVYTSGYPHRNLCPVSRGFVTSIGIGRVPYPTDNNGTCHTDLVDQSTTISYKGVTEVLSRTCLNSLLLVDTTIKSAPGASGSPMVNQTGQVVGVLVGINGMDSTAFMLPTTTIKTFVESLR